MPARGSSSASISSLSRAALPALPLIAATAGLLALWDLGRRLPAALAFLAVGFAALAWAVSRFARARREGRLDRRTLAAVVLAVAALQRLLLLPLPPTLSDDLLRYQWDGRLVLAGENPYRLAPDDPRLEPLRDDLWQRLPHRQVATVYPPLALALFTVAAALPATPWVLKGLLVAADLGGCLLLFGLARRARIPPERTAWYALNPLVALEVAGMGHVDALGAAAAVAAVAALTAARPRIAGLAAAAGALAKLAPLAALPAWTRMAALSGTGGRKLVLSALAVLAIVGIPWLVGVGGVPPGLVTYGVSWEFNGPLYEPLWRTFESLDADARLARLLDRLKERHGHHELWNRFYPYAYPQFLAKLVLLGGMLTVVARSMRGRHPIPETGRLFGGLLLFSATVYPWYLLWVLPWAALAAHRAWLALSALVLLAYLPQHAGIPLVPWVFVAVWIPFFVLLLESRWSSTD